MDYKLNRTYYQKTSVAKGSPRLMALLDRQEKGLECIDHSPFKDAVNKMLYSRSGVFTKSSFIVGFG